MAQNEATALLSLLAKDLKDKNLEHSQLEEALVKLKTLGRNADNVSNIYTEEGISTLRSYAFGDFRSSIAQEALRCIANALLLLPTTRQHSLRCGLDTKAADALSNATIEEEFLLSRILFLLTLDPEVKMQNLVTAHQLAGNIVKNLARHADQANGSVPKGPVTSGTMALMEILKLLFSATSATIDEAAEFAPAVVEILRILERMDIPSPPLEPPINLLINALANFDIQADQIEAVDIESTTDKLVSILDRAIDKYSAAELDTAAIPLLTVLRSVNEVAPTALRDKMKARLLPSDKERDQPLGKSSSLASRLLRLTTSSGMTKLSESISALMYELSDKDAHQYVKNVGYGYAAGYLMTHKIAIPANANGSQGEGDSSDAFPVNPITGQRLDREPAVEQPAMTRDEKEREAERLFVLFERLKATGVADIKNPVEVARDAGRFEELSDSDLEE